MPAVRGKAAKRRPVKKPEPMPTERVIRIAEFRATLRTFLRHSERVCRKWKLTPQRYLLLLAIKGAPDRSERMSFTDIANRLQIERNTVTELCARAEEAGLVRRERSEADQRVVYLRLTEEGERRLMGALLDSDVLRRDLMLAFEGLSEAFTTALAAPAR